MSAEIRDALTDVLALNQDRPLSDQVTAILSSGLVVPAAIHKVATDALEAGDACGAVGCRALIERDAALAELAQVTQWHAEVRQECAELRGGVEAIKAEALREAEAEVMRLDLIGNAPAGDTTAEERLSFASSPLFQPIRALSRLDVADFLRDRADALSATTGDAEARDRDAATAEGRLRAAEVAVPSWVKERVDAELNRRLAAERLRGGPYDATASGIGDGMNEGDQG